MELGAKSVEVSDPNPDIYELFNHYNSLYFDNALASCIVYWTHSRSTRSGGMFCYKEGGGCEIHLSENVLKFRSATDLKKTLLHEMVHAYLYITSNMRDRGYHGPSFQAMVNAINSSSKTDPQRPSGGYNITSSHDINKEADSNRVQNWICTSCGDLFEGFKNRVPSADDCIENMARENFCGNFSCHWHAHRMTCLGTYTKTTGKPGCTDKIRLPKDSNAQVNKGDKPKGPSHTRRQPRRTSRNVEQIKDSSFIKKTNSTVDNAPASLGVKPPSRNTYHSQSNVTKNQRQKTVAIKVEGDALIPKLHKRPWTTGFTEDQKVDYPLKEKVPKHKKRNTMSGQLIAFYANEGSDEDIRPLVNKRTERRKREKLLELKESLLDVEAVDVASSGPGTAKALVERRKGHVAPPFEDNIVYILDD